MAPSVWPWSRDNYLQDWPAWLDSNYVDIVHPQFIVGTKPHTRMKFAGYLQ